MSVIMQINPFEFFTDTQGDALDSGYIYIGQPNLDPRQYPSQVFYDEGMTIPAPQPLRTSNGYIVRNGSPTYLYIDGNYSIIVQDSAQRQVYHVPDFLFIGNGSAASKADLDALRADLANSTDLLKGSYIVGYKKNSTGSVGRTVAARLNDTVNVLDFGADPSGVADSLPAFNAARNYIQTTGDFRGGKIVIPNGYYKMSGSLVFTADPSGVHNITLEGHGILCVTLDFTSAPAGTDGIVFTGGGAHAKVSGFMIKGARRHGLSFSTCHEISIQEMRIQNCIGHGLTFNDTFMCSVTDLWSTTNGGNGINFDQIHTSIFFHRVYANSNTGVGFAINGMTYSAFVACGSDTNGTGYSVSNVRGVSFVSCGAESNLTDGWKVFSSNASQGTIPLSYRYVNGLEFIGCAAYFNSASAPGVFGNFITAVSNDANPIQFSMKGCGSSRGNVADFAVVIAGAGGPIVYRDDDPSHDGKYSITGGASVTAAGYIESIIPSGSSVSLVNNTGKSVTSITLPAGDWEVDGTVLYTPQGTTIVSAYYSGVSTTNNTLPGEQDFMTGGTGYSRAAVAATFNIRSPAVRIRSDGTTVVYLVAFSSFSAGTLVAAGKLSARKI